MRTLAIACSALLLATGCPINERDGLADGSAAATDAARMTTNADAGAVAGPDSGGAVATGFFPADSVWYRDISGASTPPRTPAALPPEA